MGGVCTHTNIRTFMRVYVHVCVWHVCSRHILLSFAPSSSRTFLLLKNHVIKLPKIFPKSSSYSHPHMQPGTPGSGTSGLLHMDAIRASLRWTQAQPEWMGRKQTSLSNCHQFFLSNLYKNSHLEAGLRLSSRTLAMQETPVRFLGWEDP